MDQLIVLKQARTITPEQQQHLTTLRAEAEALMVRKAHAFVLLKSRAHTPPLMDQLPVPSVSAARTFRFSLPHKSLAMRAIAVATVAPTSASRAAR